MGVTIQIRGFHTPLCEGGMCCNALEGGGPDCSNNIRPILPKAENEECSGCCVSVCHLRVFTQHASTIKGLASKMARKTAFTSWTLEFFCMTVWKYFQLVVFFLVSGQKLKKISVPEVCGKCVGKERNLQHFARKSDSRAAMDFRSLLGQQGLPPSKQRPHVSHYVPDSLQCARPDTVMTKPDHRSVPSAHPARTRRQ